MFTYVFTFEEVKDRKDAKHIEEIVESDGESSCKCDYHKKEATITTDFEIDDIYEDLKAEGYAVTDIEMI
jgi:hypothetical protein